METLAELKAAWNAQADVANEWHNLGEDEMVEFSQERAIAKERESIRDRLLMLHAEAKDRHNFYLHTALVIFGDNAAK